MSLKHTLMTCRNTCPDNPTMATPSANGPPGPGDRLHHVGITRRQAMYVGCSGVLGVVLNSARPARATTQDPSPGGSAKPEADRPTRTPLRVAEQLAAVYGNRFEQVAYIPALPLVAKLRLGESTGDMRYVERVNALVAPFLRGEKSPVPKSGSEQAGHLVFAELASRAQGKDRERWIRLCRAAADQIFGRDGGPAPVMPFHEEMSDAVFMAGPILAATGRLTGERKYFDAAGEHFASMRKFCLRPDGLYRHSPLCEAAWGRGNGFPALGLAFALSDWPEDHAAQDDVLAEFRKHMAALKPHQDARTGCWHQVIDHPESYDEYSCTCMIGCAMQRGVRRGWLAEEEYGPCVDRAWRAVLERTGADGELVDVCAGTGKQRTLRDYLNRPAINGRDDRGGAMGLIFAVELLATGRLHGG
jgi:rhamnogalacturonyl hydrolase YesR